MRRLRTLHRDKRARAAVGRVSQFKQSSDRMDFGLLCYEAGRHAAQGPAAEALTESMLNGDPDSFHRRLRKLLMRPSWP